MSLFAIATASRAVARSCECPVHIRMHASALEATMCVVCLSVQDRHVSRVQFGGGFASDDWCPEMSGKCLCFCVRLMYTIMWGYRTPTAAMSVSPKLLSRSRLLICTARRQQKLTLVVPTPIHTYLQTVRHAFCCTILFDAFFMCRTLLAMPVRLPPVGKCNLLGRRGPLAPLVFLD